MALTLKSVLDPQKLARENYDLMGELRKLIDQKKTGLVGYLKEKREQRAYNKDLDPVYDAKFNALKNLRKRYDYLYLLQTIPEEDALDLLESDGDPRDIDWTPQVLSKRKELEEELQFLKMKKPEMKGKAAQAKPVMRKEAEELEIDIGEDDSDDEEEDDEYDSVDADFIVEDEPRPVKHVKARSPAKRKGHKFDRLRESLKKINLKEGKVLAKKLKTVDDKREANKLVKEYQELSKLLIRYDAMLALAIAADMGGKALTKTQLKALQTATKTLKALDVGAGVHHVEKWLSQHMAQKAKKADVNAPLPASVAVATSGAEKRLVKSLKRAGATTEKGTCPLGMPPKDKVCVRGFWKEKRKPKGKIVIVD